MKSFFREIAKAVSDFKFYKEAKDFQRSAVMKYIFLLILLITLVLSVKYAIDFRIGLGVAAEWTKGNLPVIEIQNGVVSADVKQPYKIEEGGFALIIDTTGEITSLDGDEKGVLLMKNKVIYKENEVKTESYDLSQVESLRIDDNFMSTLKNNIPWIVFPFMLLGIFVYFCIARFVQVFIFSLVSLAAASITSVKLNYKQLFNIGVYAITPSVILGAVVAFFGRLLPGFGVLYAGVYIVYLVMAIRACKEESGDLESV